MSVVANIFFGIVVGVPAALMCTSLGIAFAKAAFGTGMLMTGGVLNQIGAHAVGGYLMDHALRIMH